MKKQIIKVTFTQTVVQSAGFDGDTMKARTSDGFVKIFEGDRPVAFFPPGMNPIVQFVEEEIESNILIPSEVLGKQN